MHDLGCFESLRVEGLNVLFRHSLRLVNGQGRDVGVDSVIPAVAAHHATVAAAFTADHARTVSIGVVPAVHHGVTVGVCARTGFPRKRHWLTLPELRSQSGLCLKLCLWKSPILVVHTIVFVCMTPVWEPSLKRA